MEQTASTPFKHLPVPNSASLFPASFLMLLAGWTLVNLIQAYLTPISEDEAYYIMYSRYLDWGYFDHPPMIALFIKIGNLLLNGTLGTRLLSVIAQPVSLMILWTILGERSSSEKNVYLFFGLAASIVLFQVFGFFATPDAPLLLFTSLFLLGYKRFLEKDSLANILLLAFSMAGMIYSKYHGVLVILMVIISNPSIGFRWKSWLACSIGALLFLPHILWQYNHDFPTLQYHLVTRARPFLMRNILEYWPNQLLIFNPLFLGIVVFILFRFRPRDAFDRALYFISTGILIFFFAASFRGHIEPHWTIVSSLAMLLLVFRHSMESTTVRTFVYRFLFPTIVLILAARLTLVFDILPVGLKLHGQKEWYTALGSIAGSKPVVFFNSYQHPSLYTYYTGKPAVTLDGVSYKQTQYDIWDFDEAYVGQKVLLVAGEEFPGSIPIAFPHGPDKHIYHVDNFITTRKIRISYDLPENISMKNGETITLKATLYNPYPFTVNFQDTVLPVTFQASFIRNGKLKAFSPAVPIPDIASIHSNERITVTLHFSVPELPTGKYFFGIVLKAGMIDGTFNSTFIPVHVIPSD